VVYRHQAVDAAVPIELVLAVRDLRFKRQSRAVAAAPSSKLANANNKKKMSNVEL
jgi:hypothetical protein